MKPLMYISSPHKLDDDDQTQLRQMVIAFDAIGTADSIRIASRILRVINRLNHIKKHNRALNAVNHRLMHKLEKAGITQTCQCDQLRLDFDAAIRERDKARREACERTAENLSLLGSSVRLSTLRVEHAARRGWDCFKSDHIGGTNEMAPDE